MNYQNTFKLIDRGFNRILVLLPGWAMTNKLFSSFFWPYDYLILEKIYPQNFAKDLKAAINKNNLKQVSILGFSLGGFLALEYASKYPEEISELFLVGVRPKYPLKQIEHIRKLIKLNPKKFLPNFFKACFYSRVEFKKFWQIGFLSSIQALDRDFLLAGLDYLTQSELNEAFLQFFSRTNRLWLYQGMNDEIAPIKEIIDLTRKINHPQLMVIPTCGHIPFFNSNWPSYPF